MTKTINSPSASKFPKDNEQFPLRPAPIPYLDPDIDEAPLGPAPIPYLKPSPGEETDENGEGGDNDGTEIDTGDEQDDTDNIEEKVIGVDERIQIKPTTSQPYRWICHIRIQTGNKRYIGSGFLVNIPGSTTGCILTAGHNLWMETRRYADSLEVTFPGRDVINISEPTNRASRLHYIVSPQYKQRFDRYHDYGVIILPGYQRKGFGYSAVITDADLKAATAVVFGYPGDKLQNTMWGTGGKFSTVEQMQLRYTLDTAGGQSGCPVYIWYEGYVSPNHLRPVVLYGAYPLHSGQWLGSMSLAPLRSTLQLVLR
jgi:V8-like Glu-specific endopeptidase